MTIDQNTTTLSASSDSSSKREDHSARTAVTVFPLIILGALIGGLLFPAQIAPLAKGVNCALMVITFGMGLTLMSPDFDMTACRPWPALVGALTQYIITLLAAFAVTWASRLDPVFAAGVILMGCAPGGTALNVVAYLAKGDVVLSATMIAVPALLPPLITSILTKYLAGQYMPVDAAAMVKPIMIIVFIPVVLGLLLRSFLPKLVEVILPALPWISVFGISYVVITLVDVSSTQILGTGPVVPVVVIMHNGLGLVFGYFAAKGPKVGEKAVRITAIEIGMQNSGLAAALGATHFTPEVAVPGATSSVWHNVSGSVLAAFFQRRLTTD